MSTSSKNNMSPSFVILEHDSPRGLHFDFMLEAEGTLKTWALPHMPRPDVEMTCEALLDHRIDYLELEGPISGGRGSVARWDHGTYILLRQTDREWIVSIEGTKIQGHVTLHRASPTENRWIFRLH